jgi:hypothetical protein
LNAGLEDYCFHGGKLVWGTEPCLMLKEHAFNISALIRFRCGKAGLLQMGGKCRLCGKGFESYPHILMECSNMEIPRQVLMALLQREAPTAFHHLKLAKSYHHEQTILMGGSRRCISRRQYEISSSLVAGFIAEAISRLELKWTASPIWANLCMIKVRCRSGTPQNPPPKLPGEAILQGVVWS